LAHPRFKARERNNVVDGRPNIVGPDDAGRADDDHAELIVDADFKRHVYPADERL
jgi:hypothetical protein